MLSSGYYENETWGALHKCWKGYVIVKNNYELNKMIEYATRIQKLQCELGQTISQFPDLDMPELASFLKIIQQTWMTSLLQKKIQSLNLIIADLALFRRMNEEDC